MKKLILNIAILFISQLGCYSQARVGEWQDHFSFRNVDKIIGVNNIIYGSSSNGLIIYDLKEKELRKLTKANGLSDVGITALSRDDNGTLIVGYNNGNIDLIYKDKVVNMRDLLMKTMQGSKTINNITVFGKKAYLSCNLGIVVLDLSKEEISDTYVLSKDAKQNPVYQTIVSDSIVYSATDLGIYTSPLKNPRIQIFTSWTQFSIDLFHYSDIAQFNGGFVVSRGNRDGACSIQLYKNNTILNLLNSPQFRCISVSENLVVTDRSSLTIIDKDLNIIKSLPAGTESYLSATEINGKYFLGKVNKGIFYFDNYLLDENNYTEVLPNGPFSNSVFDVISSSYGVWITPGGLTRTWGGMGIEPYYSFNDGFEWKAFTSTNFPEFSSEWDLLRVVVNPEDPSDVAMCSWGSGIYTIQQNQTLKHFDQHNSPLSNIPYMKEDNYVRVGGIAIDKNGSTWMTNSEIDSGGILVKTLEDKWYRYDYSTTKNQHSQGQILVAKNGFKWSYFPVYDKQGIFIWDDNGTVDNCKDDRYRGPDVATSIDSRNKGELRLWNSNKEVITNVIYCIAEDNNGVIWIGTNKGPVVYYRPKLIFDETYPVATQINIPRNDGSGQGDYLLGTQAITSIAIDGANRKWLGTSTSGIYLVSDDGTLQIEHFTAENSPLPSNTITCINIEAKTGEVYIGTSQGLVSYRGTALEGASDNSSVIVFPNPVRADYTGLIVIKGVTVDSNIKITDISGNLVNETESLGGQTVWDGRDLNGNKVKTGVYYIFVTNIDGTISGKTKVMIIN